MWAGIYYDTATGRVYTSIQADCNTWVVWTDDTIIRICNVNYRMRIKG